MFLSSAFSRKWQCDTFCNNCTDAGRDGCITNSCLFWETISNKERTKNLLGERRPRRHAGPCRQHHGVLVLLILVGHDLLTAHPPGDLRRDLHRPSSWPGWPWGTPLERGRRGLLVEPEEEGGADDGDWGEGHGRGAHPGLEFEAEGAEHAGGDRDADEVVDGGEDEVEPDAVDGALAEVQAAHHVEEIVLRGEEMEEKRKYFKCLLMVWFHLILCCTMTKIVFLQFSYFKESGRISDDGSACVKCRSNLRL